MLSTQLTLRNRPHLMSECCKKPRRDDRARPARGPTAAHSHTTRWPRGDYMSVAMSVAPSASSLSCSCLQAVRNGAVWAGVGRAALGRLCMHATRAPHRPEPAVAVASRNSPHSPRTLPVPLLSCAALMPRPGVRPGTHPPTHLLFGQLRLQIVQRMREAGEALRAQLELRRRRLALGLKRDLGGGCQWRQGMQEDAGEMYALNETRWVLVSGGLVVWWSGSLDTRGLASDVWFLVSGSPSALGRSIRAQPLGYSGPKHSRGGAIGRGVNSRRPAELGPKPLPQMLEEVWPIYPLSLAGGGARRGAGEAGWEWGHFSRDTLAGRARC